MNDNRQCGPPVHLGIALFTTAFISCANSTSPVTPKPAASVAGWYDLTSVNGESLPFTYRAVVSGGASIGFVDTGAVRLDSNGTMYRFENDNSLAPDSAASRQLGVDFGYLGTFTLVRDSGIVLEDTAMYNPITGLPTIALHDTIFGTLAHNALTLSFTNSVGMQVNERLLRLH